MAVGLGGAWRRECQVLGVLTASLGPVSVVRDPVSLHREPAEPWTSKDVSRGHSCQTVSGNTPAMLPVAVEWFQRPHTQTAKDVGELACHVALVGPEPLCFGFPSWTPYHCRAERSIWLL